METKIKTIKILIVAVTIICGSIICFNTMMRSKGDVKVIGYEEFKPVNLTPLDSNYIEWEDNFDTSYVDKTTGCLVITRK